MLFAPLKRILRLDRLRLRGASGARDEFHLAAAAQNLRKLAKLIPAPVPSAPAGREAPSHSPQCRRAQPSRSRPSLFVGQTAEFDPVWTALRGQGSSWNAALL